MPVRLVVAALILDRPERPRRVLAGRRTGPPALAGRWEFPGGKVEPGEDPAAALHREIGEELGLALALDRELVPDDGSSWPLGPGLVMRTWLARVAAATVGLSTDHDDLRWVAGDELAALDWLPGDRALLAPLRRELD